MHFARSRTDANAMDFHWRRFGATIRRAECVLSSPLPRPEDGASAVSLELKINWLLWWAIDASCAISDTKRVPACKYIPVALPLRCDLGLAFGYETK
jgi:hypothetical protein